MEAFLAFLGLVVTAAATVVVARINKGAAVPSHDPPAVPSQQSIEPWMALVTDLTRRMETVESRFRRLASLVRPIVSWIDDGAHPPPPHVHADLRALLAETSRDEHPTYE